MRTIFNDICKYAICVTLLPRVNLCVCTCLSPPYYSISYILRVSVSHYPNHGSRHGQGPDLVSLMFFGFICACLPSKPSYVRRFRTGRVLKRGPAPLQIPVAAACPNALQGTREIALCPNRGILLPPALC